MGQRNDEILRKKRLELQKIEDMFLDYMFEEKKERICKWCGRPESEWTDDEWLPSPFDYCGAVACCEAEEQFNNY